MNKQVVIDLEEYFEYNTDEFFEELKNTYGKIQNIYLNKFKILMI